MAWTPVPGSGEGWKHIKTALSRAFQALLVKPLEKDDAHEPFENLTQGILKASGEAKVLYCGSDLASVEEAVRQAVEENARQVVIVPLLFAFETEYPKEAPFPDILSNLQEIEKRYPEVELYFVGPPFGPRRQIDRLLSKIRKEEPEASDHFPLLTVITG